MKPWLQVKSDAEATSRSNEFWTGMSEDISAGEFWADRIKKYKNDPQMRLRIALDYLPLPAAFREASVALRSIIRTKRKDKQPHEEELALLYRLAAVCSFSIPYSEKLREPGYNIIESMPGAVIFNLSFDYRVLGYEKLELLNSTDKKWIVEAWGGPQGHSTLHEIYYGVWERYEEKLVKERQRSRFL